ncbi:MAG: hypothetical protein JSS49_22075 [Planctomycetes bacterium]|nr:hypothetical protein [Planctomycetota bacterium]
MNEISPPPDDHLDDWLRNWSRAQAAPVATVDRLQRSICRRSVSTRPPGHSRAILAVCAVAAGLLVAVIAGISVPDSTNSMNSDAISSLSESRTKLTSLWTETGRLFGPDLQWLCDLDGELQLGVSSADASNPASPVCLALTLLVYEPKEHAWKSVWTSRVACRGGEVLDFASADKRTAGSLWVQSRPDGRFAVSHWLNWKDHPGLSGSIEATVPADAPEVVIESTEAGQRIQLIQQVWRPHVG